MSTFKGKMVIVTGASQGIGRACAKIFAENGATLALHYHKNKIAAEETLASLSGAGHQLFNADLSDAIAVKKFIDEVIHSLGGIDVLINNAAVIEPHSIDLDSYDNWQLAWNKTLATNLLAPANLAFCVAPEMKKRGGGHIVNVSSRGAYRGEPSMPAYGASKAGLNSLTQSLALALGPFGIAVNAVAPGFTDTERVENIVKGPRENEIAAQSPFNRIAKPEEVAAAVLYLASDQAIFTSGAILDLNGASYFR
jgi:NAD(P)-dependent dehydrogenase (short-subunit alcohol dehydrogenase family)